MIDLTCSYQRSKIEKRIANKKAPRVSFIVMRDGLSMQRFGTITRLTPTLVWIGAFVYWHGEPKKVEEVA